MSISQGEQAVFEWVSPNETGLDQLCDEHGQPTWDDPTKQRFGAYRPRDGRKHFYLGVIGGDILTRRSDGTTHRDERLFFALKHDNNDGQPALPCFEWYAQRTEDSTDDKDNLCLARLSANGLELDPKHQAPNMQVTVRGVPIGSVGGSGGQAQQLWDGTGKYFAQMQNDGVDGQGNAIFNFVAYEASTPFSIGNPVRVLFSMNDILARLTFLEGAVTALKAELAARR